VSNIATGFIEVVELPPAEVDLGPDRQVCQGGSGTFIADVPGAQFLWSTGDTTPAITADQSGFYSVTVYDGIHCPGRDTAILEVLPIIEIALSGDEQVCDNTQAELTISGDSPFPLDIEISASPGLPFFFAGISLPFTFSDLPPGPTLYTTTAVTPAQDACIELTDSTQFVDLLPSYVS